MATKRFFFSAQTENKQTNKKGIQVFWWNTWIYNTNITMLCKFYSRQVREACACTVCAVAGIEVRVHISPCSRRGPSPPHPSTPPPPSLPGLEACCRRTPRGSGPPPAACRQKTPQKTAQTKQHDASKHVNTCAYLEFQRRRWGVRAAGSNTHGPLPSKELHLFRRCGFLFGLLLFRSTQLKVSASLAVCVFISPLWLYRAR